MRSFRRGSLSLGLSLMATSSAPVPQLSFHLAASRVHSPQQSGKRPVTIGDIVGRNDLTENQIAPDGRHAAFIVRRASLGHNLYRYALYVVPVGRRGNARKLGEGEAMSGLRWRPDGKTISLLLKRNGTAQLR